MTESAEHYWRKLDQHAKRMHAADYRLAELFTAEPARANKYSAQLGPLHVDYSKHYLDSALLTDLLGLANARGMKPAIQAMFRGDAINNTEGRAALHTALRAGAAAPAEVHAVHRQMQRFVELLHQGDWTGASGDAITDVVNVGIGGSDLGPCFVTEALGAYHCGPLAVHFVSNVDPDHLGALLPRLNPATTLFIIASKSFTTLETHCNAQAARAWVLDSGIDEAGLASHFVAISTNLEAVREFGIAEENVFTMWDWVGGRYSLWSAIGLSIALAVGWDHFSQLLDGARRVDEHFANAELAENIPVLLALLTAFYLRGFECHSTAVVPYAQRMSQLPDYLQQLYMESLGKSVSRDGLKLTGHSGEALWGTSGTNGQHSYFQLLHQGTRFIPVDFIAAARPEKAVDRERHAQLLANCFSQSMALMQGRHDAPDPHRYVAGNKPSTTILLDRLTPESVGALLALYEHKTYALSVLWDINAFDQWGVELGKQLGKSVFGTLYHSADNSALDASTRQLVNRARTAMELDK